MKQMDSIPFPVRSSCWLLRRRSICARGFVNRGFLSFDRIAPRLLLILPFDPGPFDLGIAMFALDLCLTLIFVLCFLAFRFRCFRWRTSVRFGLKCCGGALWRNWRVELWLMMELFWTVRHCSGWVALWRWSSAWVVGFLFFGSRFGYIMHDVCLDILMVIFLLVVGPLL